MHSGPSSWKRNPNSLVLKGFVGRKEWMGLGGALWVCPEVALGGHFNSTGSPVGSAKPDFWKEGEGKRGTIFLSGKPAVPGTIPFIGPWVRALFISVTVIKQNMLSPSLCHTL